MTLFESIATDSSWNHRNPIKRNKYFDAFLKCGTDKYIHRYDKFYDLIIGNNEIESVLEIGVWQGASLYAWQEIWPDAVIEGVDIKLPYKYGVWNDFNVHIGSSTRKVTQRLFGNRTYDMIVDDGSHRWLAQVQTFNNFYHRAHKYYVIEDIMGPYALERIVEALPTDIVDRSVVFESQAKLGSQQRYADWSGLPESKFDNFLIMFIEKD